MSWWSRAPANDRVHGIAHCRMPWARNMVGVAGACVARGNGLCSSIAGLHGAANSESGTQSAEGSGTTSVRTSSKPLGHMPLIGLRPCRCTGSMPSCLVINV